METIFAQALILLAAALVLLPLFQRLGLGSVLGYLAAGILVGPLGFGWISGAESVLHFAELGVVLMLFLVGLELEPAHLWAQRRRLLGLGASQVLLSAAVLALAFWLMGFSEREGLAIGAILALSSTAFVVQMLVETNQLGTPQGRAAFSILLFQDLAVIPIILLLPVLAGSQDAENSPQLFAGIAALIAMAFAGRFLLNPWLGWLARLRNRDVMTASALLLVLGSAGLMGYLGLSMGLGAFVAGVLLANSPYREQLETDIQPFKGLLLGLFFLAIGMTMDLRLLIAAPGTIALYLIALLAAKSLVLVLISRLRKVPWAGTVRFGILLSQGGEFAFVLLTQAGALGLLAAPVIGQLNLVVALSMATTPLLLKLAKKLFPSAGPGVTAVEGEAPSEDQHPKVVIAGLGRFGQITARILVGRQIPFTALDSNPDEINLLRRYGNDVFFGDVTRLDLLRTAGLEHAQVLVLAIDQAEDSLRVVELVQQHFPDVQIIARARDRYHAYELRAKGVTLVIRETFDSALKGAVMTLTQLGIPESTALELTRNFRAFDEALLEEQVEHRHDREKLIETNSRGRAALVSLLSGDQGKPD
ncbi:monovalent cation:proton antiporter-2 (CPA2) family protein [Marinobacter xestospongiae]|uniref:Monovalent cation:proton antiporter-2 (CPA2) family protein n=1 Tax=Marinobacter xestospongiae TaxID=994319 RepID=A0ABU3VXZ1_9GAMM|nr:monovalent cation:proton antiporter-2 (CPA2) family protein [Marinobacter xestospongiae]MDV2079158.1 monovalent cation:proton antiporter-2 (CPA2) family protein [Marinobacter xestospongiae]